MVSKKTIMRYIESLDDQICDLRYDLKLALKRITELERARIKKEVKKTVKVKRGVGRPKKVEEPVERKPGRPRKDAGRVDFAKKK